MDNLIDNSNQRTAPGFRIATTFLLVWGSLFFHGRSANAFDANKDLLGQHGIECNSKSLAEFFESLNPEGDVIKRTQSLLSKLGSDDFRSREKAMNALLTVPQLPLEIVKTATEDKDPEIRWRSQVVLKQAGTRSQRLLRAALNVIAEEEIEGLGTALFSCVDHYGDASLQRLAQKALLGTVTEADTGMLRESAKHPKPFVRILALRSLVSVLKDNAIEDLRPHLTDSADDIKLFAVSELAKQGDRDTLQTLSKLLESTDAKVRDRSVRFLRTITGQEFKFRPYTSAEDRKDTTKAWQEWIAANKESAKLNSDLKLQPSRVGRILVCYYTLNLVVEYDENHKEVWTQSVPQPWGCQGLPNGHRLIASYQSNEVIEYDEKGKEVWRASVPGNPTQAQRLENGNTLVSLYGGRKIVEITPEKKQVNSISLPAEANYVQRLPNGHTLVACGNAGTAGILEFNAEGKQIGKLSASHPFSAHRLENGNTLIADSGASIIKEVDPNEKVVWKKEAVNNSLDAWRLDNGHTLIVNQQGVIEVDPEGKTVWSDKRGYAIRVCYY